MKPILFDKTATTFTTNGLGRLDCHDCKVTEERNGIYELEMTIAESALHADQIEMTSIIVVRASQNSGLQAFRVYRITKPLNGVFKVYANHISYQLSLIPTMPFSVVASSSACQDTLDGLISNAVETCPFTLTTDVTTVASYKQTTPSSIRSRLGGVEGSVLDQFGGEYEWDNYDVTLHANRGVTTPTVTLRYGKNITDLNQEENIANTITGIVPFWADNEGNNVVTLPEKVIDSPYASSYPFKRTVPHDFSDNFEEEPTELQLRTKAQAYVANIGVPVVSIKLSFVNLADTEEYKDIAPLQSVNLCDLINVQFEKYNISTTAKIVKTVYDVLGEKYESLEIGSLRSNLATTINDQNVHTATEISSKFAKVGTEIDNATAWLTSSGGYVVAVKNTDGSWKELLFLDTNDIDTAHNVLRINENGIGFSSNGVSGPYTQAWTLDGRLVIGGTNVPSITVYDSNNQIIFQASSTAIKWNATNSNMTDTGVITASGANFTNTIVTNTSGNYKSIMAGSTIDFYYRNNLVARIDAYGAQSGSGNMTLRGENSSIDIWAGKDTVINADRNLYLQTGGSASPQGSGGSVTIGADKNITMFSSAGYITISATGGTLELNSDRDINILSSQNVDISVGTNKSFSIDGVAGTTGTITYVDEVLFDTYTFTTDLYIASDMSSFSYTNVTLDVATGYTTDTFDVYKGIVY